MRHGGLDDAQPRVRANRPQAGLAGTLAASPLGGGSCAALGITQPVKRRLEIDGARFGSLEEFYDEVGEQLIPGATWGRNLDAFDDILRGGFGTPDEGFVLVWKNHAISRERLGYKETVR